MTLAVHGMQHMPYQYPHTTHHTPRTYEYTIHQTKTRQPRYPDNTHRARTQTIPTAHARRQARRQARTHMCMSIHEVGMSTCTHYAYMQGAREQVGVVMPAAVLQVCECVCCRATRACVCAPVCVPRSASHGYGGHVTTLHNSCDV